MDTTVDSNTAARFYLVGDAQTDTDADGLTDARERRMYGTSATNLDTDVDGLPDGQELALGTDPASADTDADGFVSRSEALRYYR